MTISDWPTACMPFVVKHQHFLLTSREEKAQRKVGKANRRKNCKVRQTVLETCKMVQTLLKSDPLPKALNGSQE